MPNEEIVEIEIERIRPFGGLYGRGYFSLKDKKVEELKSSIEIIGIIEPLVVRYDKSEIAEYELIAGETRMTAAKEIGLKTVPCVIKNLTDAEALALYGESNRYRNDLTITERAFMIRYAEELKDKKMQSGQNVLNVDFVDLDFEERNKRRYIRLTYLTTSLRDLVDIKRVNLTAACQASYLPVELQEDINFVLGGNKLILTSDAVDAIKRLYENERRPFGKKLSFEEVEDIIQRYQPKHVKQKTISLSRDIIEELPPEYRKKNELKQLVEQLLLKFVGGV